MFSIPIHQNKTDERIITGLEIGHKTFKRFTGVVFLLQKTRKFGVRSLVTSGRPILGVELIYIKTGLTDGKPHLGIRKNNSGKINIQTLQANVYPNVESLSKKVDV
jgi:hypothetical protein